MIARFRNFLLPLIALPLIALTFGAYSPLQEDALDPPFRLPFKDPPGYSTWYLGQPYGNTLGAYRMRDTTYVEGQGLHFGVDLIARCDTPVLAIGDGVVYAVDGPNGAGPHNVVIKHDNGFFSLYGHLRYRSTFVTWGQRVKAGDVVGVVGDWLDSVNCRRAPHLHLEIRIDAMRAAVNPIPLIDGPWQDAGLGIGSGGSGFELDLDQPRRWQTLLDQPSVIFGGPILNDYSRPWPPG